MGKIQPQKFTVESFKDQSDWIGPLLSNLNSFISDVVQNFSNQMTVSENLFQEIKEITWINSATNFPIKFKTKFAASPKGLSVIYLFNETDQVYSTAAPWLEWRYANGEIIISNISGLTASDKYTIRLLVIYG